MASKRKKPATKRPPVDLPFAAPDWPGLPTMWSLEKVKPYAHNARTHPPAQVTLLAQLLKKWGPDQAIVVDENAIILKGHGRRLAALEAGIAEFPVVQRLGLPEDEKRAMRIADNQVALLAGWDGELVRFEVESLKRGGYDVALLGFGEQQLVHFMTTPGPPGAFPKFGEDIATEHECPKCHYRWSGKPTPEADGDKSSTPAARRKKAK